MMGIVLPGHSQKSGKQYCIERKEMKIYSLINKMFFMKQFTSYRFVWYKQKWLYSALVTCSLLLLFSPVCLFSQAPTIQWNKTIGGNNNDNLLSLRPTSYGGYISGGHSNSDISGDKTEKRFGTKQLAEI